MTGWRVIVCGGRDWSDRDTLNRLLDKIMGTIMVGAVIEGDANGADRMAAAWAYSRGIPVETYPADWNHLGKAAGRIRNHRMLRQGRPDLVVAFPTMNSVGTWHMVGIARADGLPVLVLPRDEAQIALLDTDTGLVSSASS